MISFYMPTKIIFDYNVLQNNESCFTEFGSKVLIVTGRQSAVTNGSLNDVSTTLEKAGLSYYIFSEIMENPTLDILDKAATQFREEAIDLVVGIGGGSPLDAAKGIAVLLNNKNITSIDLQQPNTYVGLPVIAIPTTAGTGSETTPYAIFTDHEKRTKANFKCKVFPKYALLDPKYFKFMPLSVLKSTAVDSLSHILEGYLSVKSNPISDIVAEKALVLWSKIKEPLIHGNLSNQDYENLIFASTFAGMVISQTGTSLPHAFGYFLTYHHNIPHGNATACFLGELFSFHENKEKINKALDYLNFNSIHEFKNYLKEIIGPIEITQTEAEDYISLSFRNKTKLKNHPYPVTKGDVEKFYYRSVKVVLPNNY